MALGQNRPHVPIDLALPSTKARNITSWLFCLKYKPDSHNVTAAAVLIPMHGSTHKNVLQWTFFQIHGIHYYNDGLKSLVKHQCHHTAIICETQTLINFVQHTYRLSEHRLEGTNSRVESKPCTTSGSRKRKTTYMYKHNFLRYHKESILLTLIESQQTLNKHRATVEVLS